MNEEKAKAYLKRKGKDDTDEELVEETMRSGKIFGDPAAFIN